MKLSEHFTLAELTVSTTAAQMNIENDPDMLTLDNLKRLAHVLEKVRHLLGGHHVIITSGYRSPKLNAAVGGVKDSAHVSGHAVDFTCPGFGSPAAICHHLKPHLSDLRIDQLILEFHAWVHLGLSDGVPRHMALTVDNSGTRHDFG